MGPTGNAYRVLQIHPTLRCNLRCLHCYSLSGPEMSSGLHEDLLRNAIIDAASEGYTVAGFSGGEPLLYKPLRRLLEQAHQCGMVTTVTSNGMLLDERRLKLLRGAADLLAISLDGTPESHNRMRASDRAFDVMASRLEGVRASGIPFGFIFTLTQHNLHELEWVAHFALEQEARLLQIHPLEFMGRARSTLPRSRPDEVEAAYAFLEARRIQEMAGDRLHVQLDLVHRAVLQTNPDRVFAGDEPLDSTGRLAEIVSPLIIEADGMVVPIEYGFNRDYALGNLHTDPLQTLGRRWRCEKYSSFRLLCREVFEEVSASTDLPFINWYDLIGRRAEMSPEVACSPPADPQRPNRSRKDSARSL